MQWYDPFLILLAIVGIMFIVFSSYHEKKGMLGGLLMILIAIGVKIVIWFVGLI